MQNATRCSWSEKDDLYRAYHDEEWGKPVYDDSQFFEFIILESFQAGLSWHTILKKREGFRVAFDGFDVQKIAGYSLQKIEELKRNSSIIRNRLKIEAAISNAQSFIKIQDEFGSFSNYIWNFVDGKPVVNRVKSLSEIPAITSLSDTIAKDLKKRGFKFMGSTVVYAFLQATGLVDDHLSSCFCAK
ncbi:MAG: DNA-3-methyladenine glycosylase I [Bacteroidetes bacterium]|nr:DNA-3-methyladenine glycosylase I [Bacteroidota bacterium]